MTDYSTNTKSRSTLSTFSSSGSDSSSTGEEERLRNLFISCDSNQDGMLDSHDLQLMCQKLNVVELAEEIIHTLGANVKGAISFDEFMKCRKKVLQLDEKCENDEMITQVDSSASDNSLINSGAEYDSGAQDLNMEPHNIHRLLKQAYPDLYRKFYQSDGALSNASLAQLMECVNSVHLSKLNSLRNEIRDLSNRLQGCQTTREVSHKELYRLQKERSRLKSDLSNQAARYEDRLTELHSVIAELHRKVERHDAGVIPEEDENELEEEEAGTIATSLRHQQANSSRSTSLTNSIPEHYQKQIETLKTGQAFLQEKISNYENLLDSMRVQMSSLTDEKEMLRRQVLDLRGDPVVRTPPSTHGPAFPRLGSPINNSTVPSSAVISRGASPQKANSPSKSSSGKPTSPSAISSTSSAPGCWWCGNNPGLKKWSEMLPTTPSAVLSSLAECPGLPSRISDACWSAHNEVERLQANLDKARADKWLLQLSLEESKCTSTRLQCLVSQLEANCGALVRAHSASDGALEILDVLLQLSESELQVLLGNCRAAGLPGSHSSFMDTGGDYANLDSLSITPNHPQTTSLAESDILSSRARQLRRQAESTARQLLMRLEGSGSGGRQTPDSGAASTVGSGGSGSSWLKGDVTGGACTGGSVWRVTEDRRIRGHLERLMSERSLLRYSVADVDSGSCPSSHGGHSSSQMSLPLSSPAVSSVDIPTDGPPGFDLENAVLLQELCGIKEERADLKARLYLLEKELRSSELALEGKVAIEHAYMLQIEHLKSELYILQCAQTSASAGHSIASANSSNAFTSTELKLKAQIQDLMQSLEHIRLNSEIRQQQSEEFTNDLKKANAALIAAFEKAKKMYQTKIKKLETQISLSGTNNIANETAL